MRAVSAVAVLALLMGGCAREAEPPSTAPEPTPASTPAPTPTPRAEPVLMPDLIGLPSETAFRRLARIQEHLPLRLSWARPVALGCETRPHTVARQRPAPGSPLRHDKDVVIRTAELDLADFRGPCEPEGGVLGPVRGSDAVLARAFYRFAADPTLGGPFAADPTWLGIESGLWETTVAETDRDELDAWRMDTNYAEASGPMLPLDLVAGTGGYFEVHHGIVDTCTADNAAPDALRGLRAISITPPSDVVGSCMQMWAVTLFVDGDDLIRGVALRMGSP